MRALLDTCTCIDVLRGRPAVVNRLSRLTPADVGISVVTLYELHAGIQACRDPAREAGKVARLLTCVRVLPFLEASALAAARVRSDLARRGQCIGPYDVLLAGQALAGAFVLVTANTAEFARVPGLTTENWRDGA